MSKKILGKKLLFITAHPDDESFLACGTMLQNHSKGGSNALFCASKGEKGTSYIKSPLISKNLKTIREKELNQAIKRACVQDFCVGDFPDGFLEKHKLNLKNTLNQYVKNVSPDIVVSFGMDGFTGHTDHIVIGSIAKSIAENLKIPFAAFSHPPVDICLEFKNFFNKKQKQGCYQNKNLIHKPNIHIKVDGAEKLKILKIYKSQFEGLNPYNIFPKDIAKHCLNNEYFILE